MIVLISRRLRRPLAVVMALIVLVLGLLLTVSQWLPRLAGFWLPADTRIELEKGIGFHQHQLVLQQIRYLADDCAIATLSNARLGWKQGRWQLQADKLTLNSLCWQNLSSSPGDQAPRTLQQWQALLPGADIHLATIEVLPWQQYAGQLDMQLDAQQQVVHFRGDNLQLDASLAGQQLHISHLQVQDSHLPQPVTLEGNVELPPLADGAPLSGAVNASLSLTDWPQPLNLALQWQQQQGTLEVTTASQTAPLLHLPWHLDQQQIVIENGQYQWPLSSQPLSGFLTLRLDNWRAGLDATTLTGRLNVLTQGRGGKGNAVLNIGPGKLSLTESQLPLQLTGESKLSELQLYATLHGVLSGAVMDPQLAFQPGSLLRLRGRVLDSFDVQEARWPLAGVRLSSQGINGRLQAIVRANNPLAGPLQLHLDGGASNFWPDSGEWRWRYWGSGELRPVNARWQVQGNGGWQQTLIHFDQMEARFNQFKYGIAQVDRPLLKLTAPVNWQRDPGQPAFSGSFSLSARGTTFDFGGRLPPGAMTFDAKGRDPGAFIWRGAMQAGEIGPLRVHGRWDGSRLRGEAWWPTQSLKVFQTLLNPDLKLQITGGDLQAQVAFSAASDQGFRAGGHWLVKKGSLLLPDSEINGLDFSLPFRLENQRWQLGIKNPVALRIGEYRNQFTAHDIRADLMGFWPWSESHPLSLQDVSMRMLDGEITLAQLRLPQHQAATVKLNQISMSHLVTALKPKQLAMSGRIDGELPLWLENSQWLVQQGWIANSGPLTLRLDKDMADALTRSNFAAGAALDWLRYMEIHQARTRLDLTRNGDMTLQAQVQGTSRFSNRNQLVNLNYRQQENLFQLWQSLRFGDNVQSRVAQQATLPEQKDAK
ncbi:YdbH family protein [Pantoea sp. A4]|uniref:YdbH family protein n=1 Tax=Pantoea sp. A4 TaxID=1225184 RepID=UPI0005619A4A|nr:YdbH family protein [Pantoea sp. A4]